nr:hypothetical protein [Calditrichia bacterium]
MSIRRTILVLFSIALSGLWGCSGDGTGPQPPEGDLWRSANGPFGPPPSQYVPGRTDREWLAFRPGHGVYRSPDRGERWEPFHEGLPTDAGRLFRRNSGDILFLGPTGLFRPGQGEVWEPVGLNQSSLTCMAESPSGNLILATQSGSLQRSSDGNNWTTLPAPAGQKAKALLAATDSLIFMITDGHTLLHSTNGGENWATFPGQYANPDDFSSMVWEDGFLFINTARGMLRFTAANAQPEIFFENSGTSYMCRSQGRLFFSDQAGTRFSTDRGDSWESLPSPPGSPRATALAIGPEGILLFSGINGRSYRSENGGNTWRRTGLPNSAVLSLAYDGQALWAGSGENSLQKQLPGSDTWQDAEGLPDYVRLVESDGQTHLYTAGRTGRFFFSSDAGSSWDNLPATPAFNASYDLLTNRFGHVFLATDIGLCRSTTRGVTWETITEGIGPHFLQSLGSSPDNILFGG